MEDIKRIAEEIFDELVAIRRCIHEHPELEFHEYKTAELICSYLEKWGIPHQKGIAKTGVLGLIMVDPKAKTLLMRADMDALPVQEETGVSYQSKTSGVMHACGHDAHVAILLGCAYVLSKIKNKLSCNIKLVFQPGEEESGGALPMIEQGILENPHVDAAIGGHVMNSVPAGKILVKYDEVMASPDDFDLVIHGKGGHGAYPHNCVDPIAVAVQILTAWNVLSARYTTPLVKHVISTNMFHAGTCYNVIPNEVVIKGTVRTFDDDLRKKLATSMEKIAVQIAEAFGASCEFNFIFRYPPLLNDKTMVDSLLLSAGEILGRDNVMMGTEPSMAGEDFAYFAQQVPSVFMNFGSGNEALGAVMPLHSSKFNIDETCLKTGVMAICKFALDFGKQKGDL